MPPSLCRSCLAFLLKFLNFLQTFVGVSIVIYSVWMLNQWNKHDMGIEGGIAIDFSKLLPKPWFVYLFMGIGVLMCLITFTGHVAAEASSGCCLCFYAMLTTVLIILEAVLVGDLVFNKHWEEDLPKDPTGELENLRKFVESNVDICKWAGIILVVIQALSLLLAMILRAMVSTRRLDYDSDEDFAVIRRPLLNPQYCSTSASTAMDSKGMHTDIWSARMREKYGLNQSEFSYNIVDPKASPLPNAISDDRRLCSIL